MPQQSLPPEHTLHGLAQWLLYAQEDTRKQGLIALEAWHDALLSGHSQTNYQIFFNPPKIPQSVAIDADTLSASNLDELMDGMRHLIEMLCRRLSNALPVEENFTHADLANSWHISTKTLQRWRHEGLRWRWGKPTTGGRTQVIFPHSSTQAFANAYPERISKASTFTQMSEIEKDALLIRAKRLSNATDCSLHACAAHLAKRTKRSAEAIRQLFLKHDHDHPEVPIFPTYRPPINDETRLAILRAWDAQHNIQKICRDFDCSRASAYRALHTARIERILEWDLEIPANYKRGKIKKAVALVPAEDVFDLPSNLTFLKPWLGYQNWTEEALENMLSLLQDKTIETANACKPILRGLSRSHYLANAECAFNASQHIRSAIVLSMMGTWYTRIATSAKKTELDIHLLQVLPELNDSLLGMTKHASEKDWFKATREQIAKETHGIPRQGNEADILEKWLINTVQLPPYTLS